MCTTSFHFPRRCTLFEKVSSKKVREILAKETKRGQTFFRVWQLETALKRGKEISNLRKGEKNIATRLPKEKRKREIKKNPPASFVVGDIGAAECCLLLPNHEAPPARPHFLYPSAGADALTHSGASKQPLESVHEPAQGRVSEFWLQGEDGIFLFFPLQKIEFTLQRKITPI